MKDQSEPGMGTRALTDFRSVPPCAIDGHGLPRERLRTFRGCDDSEENRDLPGFRSQAASGAREPLPERLPCAPGRYYRAAVGAHQLWAVIESSPLPIVTYDIDGTVTSWNTAAAILFGWTAAEVLGGSDPSVLEDERADHTARIR